LRILLTADAELPVPPLLYGGIERVIASLCEEFSNLGHSVGLVAHRDSSVSVDSFYPWPGLSSTRRIDSLRNSLTLVDAVRRFKPDVIHSFSRLAWLWPLKLFAPTVPIVMSYQREPSGKTIRLSRRWLGDRRLCFTGCSEYITQNGRDRGGGNWTAVPNFVDLSKFDFVEKVPDDAPLVFLSRIEKIKGAHNAIAIAKGAKRRLIIAGNRVDDEQGSKYWNEEIAPELGRNGIEYLGAVDDVQKNKLLGQAAAMVVPIEWNEPFGIVFAEALACGTPVIACPRGALPSIVQDGVHGFLVNSVAEGIASVGRIQEIRRQCCRERVTQKFSVATVAREYLKIYSQSSDAAQ
jgi:glycosyltransferase involved in cell wall biosynthesis